MPEKKKSIYTPKKGRNISQKRLYKLPPKGHGQKGGGIMSAIGSFFKGGEIPGSPEVDGDGNVVDIENDTNDESQMSTLTSDKTPDETSDKTPDEKKPDGLLQGIGKTVGQSIRATTGEINDYMSQSSTSVDDSDNESLMESSSVNIQVPCDELLAENKLLHEKVDQLQEEIKELLKKEVNRLESGQLLDSEDGSFSPSPIQQNSLSENNMEMDSPGEFSQPDPNVVTMEQSPESSSEMNISPESQDQSMETGSPGEFSQSDPNVVTTEQSPESSSEMDISQDQSSMETGSQEEFGQSNPNVVTMDNSPGSSSGMDISPDQSQMDENLGGTKRRRKKNRKTKRKRNKHVSFK